MGIFKGTEINLTENDSRPLSSSPWAGVNATLDTAIETGFTYAFGTDEQKANYSIRGTLGKNFAINLATGGLGNKIKWLGRGGQYAFRVAADVLIGASYDVYANNQDVSDALVSNSLGTAGGEVLGALARRGGRYLARNFEFDTDVLRGAAPTSGFNPFPFRRRAQVGYSQSYAANFDAAFDPAAAVPIPRTLVSSDLLAAPKRLQNKLAAWRRYKGDLDLAQWSRKYDQLQVNRARSAWAQSFGEPGARYATPYGARIVDNVPAIEIKTGYQSATKFVRRQVIKDSFLRRTIDGYNPEWRFIDQVPSRPLLNKLDTFGIPYRLSVR